MKTYAARYQHIRLEYSIYSKNRRLPEVLQVLPVQGEFLPSALHKLPDPGEFLPCVDIECQSGVFDKDLDLVLRF
jgi:hypothetical protein